MSRDFDNFASPEKVEDEQDSEEYTYDAEANYDSIALKTRKGKIIPRGGKTTALCATYLNL